MKIVDIIPRQICVKLEITKEETASLVDFFEKSILLYAKVHLNSATDDSLSVPTEFKSMLTSVMKNIEKEAPDDT